MTSHDIIVIGASAGGIEAMTRLVRSLPRNLPAALFAVFHIPAHSPSLLPEILSRAGTLPALHPADNAAIAAGQIYVAPPDHHLMLERGYVRLVRGPKENRHRPAVDPFRCRVGHAFSAENVLAEQSEVLDKALWVALRTLEEKVGLLRRLASQAREQGRDWLAQGFEGRVAEAKGHANLLRQLLINAGLESSASEAEAKRVDGFIGDMPKSIESDRRE